MCSLHGFSNCQLSLLATLQRNQDICSFQDQSAATQAGAHNLPDASPMHGNGNTLVTYQQKADHLLHSREPLHLHVLETRTQLNTSLTIVQRPERLFRSHNLVPESPRTPCLRKPRWTLPLCSHVGVGRQLPVAQARTTRAPVILLEVRLRNKRCTHQPRQLQLQA